MAGGSRSSGRNFYPRPPRGGRLGAAAQIGEGKVDFYPRPPRGGRPGGGVLRVGINEFLSTPSARRATWRALARPTPTGYFYPRPPRGGRQRACRSLLKKSNFYPRPPRGGRRPQPPDRRRSGGDFYPRPPRGGRPLRADNVADGEDISIHALREEGDQDGQAKANRAAAISIHALREEGDGGVGEAGSTRADFYPRPPRGGRQSWVVRCCAPLADFYPRPPRGGRQRSNKQTEERTIFLSTPSARRATKLFVI